MSGSIQKIKKRMAIQKIKKRMAAAAAARLAEQEQEAAAASDRWSSLVSPPPPVFPTETEADEDNQEVQAQGSIDQSSIEDEETEGRKERDEDFEDFEDFDGSLTQYFSLSSEVESSLQYQDPQAVYQDYQEEEDEAEDLEDCYSIEEEQEHNQEEEEDQADRNSLLIGNFTMASFAIVNQNSCQGLPTDAKSTSKLYRRVHSSYCRFASTVDVDTDKKPRCSKLWLVAAHDVNRLLVRRFIDFFVKTRPIPSAGHITEALCYLQRRLSDEMQECGTISRKGAIREDATWINGYKRQFQVEKASLNKSGFKDIQAKIESRIPRSQELQLIDTCYDLLQLPRMKLLARSNLASAFAHAGQAGTRGSDSRSLNFNHGFLKEMEFLGDGEDVDHFVHNEGKTNRTGRIEYKAFATHMNPRLDASAHLGLSLLLRFNVLHEPFPNFLKPKDYASRPVYRSSRGYSKHISPSGMHDNWKRGFEHVGIVCQKLTHQPRIDLQQRIADKGCTSDMIERFIGYAPAGTGKMNDNQRDSYLCCPPVQAVAAAADGDPLHPGSHHPGWDVSLNLGPTGDIAPLCPWLYHELAKVKEAFESSSPKQRIERCLHQALGSLKAFERRIEHAVKLVASLPLDSKNILSPEAPPIFVRWERYPVLNHDYFRSELFSQVVTKVQSAQKQDALLMSDDTTPQQKSYFQRELSQHVTPNLQHNLRSTQSLKQDVAKLQSTMESFASILRYSKPNTASSVEKDIDIDEHPLSLSPSFSFPSPLQLGVSPMSPSPPASSYDKELTKKGKPRQRAPHESIQDRPFSSQNITAKDFWMEYQYGRNKGYPLKQLETEHGAKWRSDKLYKRVDGTPGTSLKAAWCLQKPLYEIIEFVVGQGTEEDVALTIVQEIIDRTAWKSGKPNFGACRKHFREYMSLN
jgi:hypothetical protein